MKRNLFGFKAGESLTASRIVFIILFTIIAIIINTLGPKVAVRMEFPLFLDSTMTIAVVALCGAIPGFICALMSNILLSISTHETILFSVCHIFTALLAWAVFYTADKKEEYKSYMLESFLWAGLWSAISNGILGNLISDLVFAANTGLPSANIVIQGIYGALPNLSFANNLGGFMENIIDKMLSALISFSAYKIVLLGKIKFN